MPYLLALLCSACSTLLAFCATHRIHAETPASSGESTSMPPVWLGTSERSTWPKKVISMEGSSMPALITSIRPISSKICTAMGMMEANGLYL